MTGVVGLLLAVLAVSPTPASDSLVVDRIRGASDDGSRVMEYAFTLSDRFGPRMTGTPAFRDAGAWAMDALRSAGVPVVHEEPIPWGRGWRAGRVSVELVEPQNMSLIAGAVPWSPSTGGAAEGRPVVVKLPEWETPTAYRAFFEQWRGRLRGTIILATEEPDTSVARHVELPPRRMSDDEFRAYLHAAEQGSEEFTGAHEEPYDPDLFSSEAYFAWQDSLHRFLRDEGVVSILYSAGTPGGTIHLNGPMRLQPAWLRHPNRLLPPPTFVVAPEHYRRLLRLEGAGTEARVRVDLDADFFDASEYAFNVIAELPGSDPSGEIVMVGAHMDAWPLATGATDNAAGVAVVMEAMRILASLERPPKRTIRAALWGGHEGEGLGSRVHVKRHFDAGYPETWLEQDERGYEPDRLPGYDLLSAYFNIDYLAGPVRGLFLQQNEALRPIVASWLRSLQKEGANHLTLLVGGGSDHMAFEDVGLPGLPFLQDGPAHGVHTHHSNMDVFDYLSEPDLRTSAVVVAAIVYLAANHDERLPRRE